MDLTEEKVSFDQMPTVVSELKQEISGLETLVHTLIDADCGRKQEKGSQSDTEVITPSSEFIIFAVMKNEKPSVVKIHGVKIDSDYVQWIGEIKSRYRAAQIKSTLNSCSSTGSWGETS